MATKFLISGAWNTNASWSTTSSAGPANTTKPGAGDDVIFDSVSGACTIDAASVCRSIDLTGTGGTGLQYANTLTHNAFTLTIGTTTANAGLFALKFPASGWTYTLSNAATSAITFASTVASTTQTVDFGGKTTGTVVFNAAATSGYQLLSAITQSSSSARVTLTQGTLDTNSQTITTGGFNGGNTNTKTLTLGSTVLTASINGGAGWIMNATNTTLNAGTSTLKFTSPSVQLSFGSGLTYYNVEFNPTGTNSGNAINAPSCTFNSLKITCTGAGNQLYAIPSAFTATTFIVTSTNAGLRAFIASGDSTGAQTPGVPVTITASSTTLTNVDFADITAAGGATWSGTTVGNALGNTGITFTPAVTRYAVAAGTWSTTATWAATSGGATGASIPICHDTVIFDANSGAGTYTANCHRPCADLDCTGFTGTLSISSVPLNMYGSVTWGSGMTLTATSQSTTFAARSSKTITSAGKAFFAATVLAPGGTYTLNDAFSTSTATFSLKYGTFNANNFGVTCGAFFDSGVANPRTLTMGSGTWTVIATTGSVWGIVAPSGLTINANTSTIAITDTSANAKTFTGAGFTYNNLSITGGGTGSVTFTDASTFNTFTIGAPKSVVFTSGTTTTVSNFVATGSSGNLVTITSTTPSATATLSKSSGTVSCDWLSLTDSTATGGAAWYAGANSTGLRTSGWIFANAPTAAGGFFEFM